ncbi:MAG: cupin domain-containing protein [Ignavibacteria bacterium]
MKKDTVLPAHKTDNSISFHVLEGQLEFTTDEKSVILGKGQFLTLQAEIQHVVKAFEESVFLLTLATGKYYPAEVK